MFSKKWVQVEKPPSKAGVRQCLRKILNITGQNPIVLKSNRYML